MQLLDITNPEEVAEYERGFYKVFAPIVTNRLIRKLWDWDEEAKRLRTRVPYEEQTIFVQKDSHGRVNRALAVGTQLATVQSRDYGFEIESVPENSEALTFFTVGSRRLGETKTFYESCRQRLVERGHQDLYGTCAPRVLKLYLWVGAEVIETREIEGETRHFFRIRLDQNTRWRPEG